MSLILPSKEEISTVSLKLLRDSLTFSWGSIPTPEVILDGTFSASKTALWKKNWRLIYVTCESHHLCMNKECVLTYFHALLIIIKEHNGAKLVKTFVLPLVSSLTVTFHHKSTPQTTINFHSNIHLPTKKMKFSLPIAFPIPTVSFSKIFASMNSLHTSNDLL